MTRLFDPASAGSRHRSAMKLLTMTNHKTVKGEAIGYLTAILYLMPHTSGGGKTLCPHSTPACREMCLAGAGLSGLPRQLAAKQRRTDLWLQAPSIFIRTLLEDFDRLKRIAAQEGLKPAVRLNGTSDIVWERVLMLDPKIQFYDYTKIPLDSRSYAGGRYHLTYSVESAKTLLVGVRYLREGHSIAVVVPETVQHGLAGLEIDLGGFSGSFVDGDEHDLRFLDGPGSIVLLKPKGRVRNDLIRPEILAELKGAAKELA